MSLLQHELKWPSIKARKFTESVIREMTRVANAVGAVNLAQGFPDFPAPDDIKAAAIKAIDEDINQYAVTWGSKPLRDAIARKMSSAYGLSLDPDREVTVCCGSTEGMISTLLAVVNPGDEVVIFEPFYENYGPDVILCGATPRYVTLQPPHFQLDEEALAAVFNGNTRAVVLNTPNNPTGKVFSREELELIAKYCLKFDALAITDEIYEHILYSEAEHIPMATLDGMRDRTVTINSASKTYSVTGWRIGYVIASPEITDAVRKVHDFLTVGAAAPLQQAVAAVIGGENGSYYTELREFYQSRRDFLLSALTDVGFVCSVPQGAYYIMADITGLTKDDDTAFARRLATDIGVAVVPGSSFFRDGSADGRKYVRFCFCKKTETLEEAARRLGELKGNG